MSMTDAIGRMQGIQSMIAELTRPASSEANAAALKPEYLTCTVTWNSSNAPLSTTNYEDPTGNTVTVKVTYKWFPEVFLVGPITLTSTSTTQMLY